MRYLIDGYNLMFRSLHSGKNLQDQREELIDHINSMVKICDMDVVMVFDGSQERPYISRSHYDSLEIVFTHEGKSADDHLVSLVKHSNQPARMTVVTNDNKLAWRVRRQGGKTEGIDPFMRKLYRRTRNVERRAKEEGTQTAPPIAKKPKGPKKREFTVKSGYQEYLQEFQRRFEKLEIEAPKKGRKPISEMERWRQIFEQKLSDLEDN